MVLLKAVDRQLGVTEAVAGCLRERRQPGKVQHDLVDLVRQRIFGLIGGYPDGNDAARLADDAIFKLLLDRDPLAGPALASQPTLSRVENAIGPRALTRLGHALADLVIGQHCARLRGRARRITIDFDPTDDPTHGQQEFAFFNGHYDTWCYLPLLGFVNFADEAEQYVLLALLRPGTRAAKLGASNQLRRLFAKLRPPFPRCGCGSAWMAGSPATTCCGSWKPRGSSTSWPSARTAAWRSGCDGSWGKRACSPRPAGRPRSSSARPAMRPAGGRRPAASS
jgi:Transposase DDE domain group 1